MFNDEVTEAEFTPEDFGVERSGIDQIVGGDAEANLEITRSVLAGVKGAHRDAVIVNASPALVLAGIADGFVSGVKLAARAIDDGRAADVLGRSLEMSKRL